MKRPPKRDSSGSPEDWLAHAESDLDLAKIARDRKSVLPEQACFHAQQAAEKSLKAILLFKQVEFPLTHDIEELIELATQNGLALPKEISEAGSLTPYAAETRYPGHLDEVTPSDVDEAIRLADAILLWAVGLLGNR